MRQVQYLANDVKMENPVYVLSNEMLKFFSIHMKHTKYKYFALFEFMSLIFSALFKDSLMHFGRRCHYFWGKVHSRKQCIRALPEYIKITFTYSK